MSNLGTVLAYKFGNAQGITTKNDEIVEWPKSLGNPPTKQQIAQYEAEYEADVSAKRYLESRKAEYLVEFGGDPWNVLDTVIGELAARGATQTQGFSDLVSKMSAIKQKHPKP